VSAFEESGSVNELRVAKELQGVGQVMAVSELRSARRYWHVRSDAEIKIYPTEYTAHVVGMLWQTMAQFQTWFGSASYLAVGIQLLPLTPIAEQRDSLEWSKEMYHSLADSCMSSEDCMTSGWSMLELAILATVGHPQLAFKSALVLPAEVFVSPGGNGHSLTNTLWYLATRPYVGDPLPLDKHGSGKSNDTIPVEYKLTDCYQPETCTDYVLDTIVTQYSCRQRMQWLMKSYGLSQKDACAQVAVIDYPDHCGPCDPYAVNSGNATKVVVCPPCSVAECMSDLNRCPRYRSTYVCTSGTSRGGCADSPWNLEADHCEACCELNNCAEVIAAAATSEKAKTIDEGKEANCPPCSRQVCRESKKSCPANDAAPYFCFQGLSSGGCSPGPWSLSTSQCEKCCKMTSNCNK
jgi:Glycosyl hydrolase family 81 C-terminal domain